MEHVPLPPVPGRAEQPVTGNDLVNDRTAVYGDTRGNLGNTGAILRAMIKARYNIDLPEDPPAWWIGILMVQIKLMRATRGRAYHADNFDDAHAYLDEAERLQREDAEAHDPDPNNNNDEQRS